MKKRDNRDLVQRILKLLNLVLIALIFEIVWLHYYLPQTQGPFNNYAAYLFFGLYCALYLMYTKIYDGFLVFSSRIYELICGQALAAMIADLLMFIVIWLTSLHFPNPLPILMTLVVQITISTLWSVVVHRWYFASHGVQHAAFICDDEESVAELIGEHAFQKRFVVDCVARPEEIIHGDYAQLATANTIFIGCSASGLRNEIVTACADMRKGIYLIPDPEDVIFHGAKQVHMFHSAVLRVNRGEPMVGYDFVKRAFDIAVSLIAIIVLSPFIIGTAIAIKLDDGGPVFYKQERLTRGEKLFKILKFRSMRVDAEKDGVARLSTGDSDPRVTKVGRFIRKTRLDEIPQLINILAGDMSFVGPRPERPSLTEQYVQEIPQFKQRLRVKAGLTGYAQVYGKYNATPRNKLLMDMVYIEHRSLWEDLQILFATMKVILMPDATEGVAEGQTTASRKQ